MTKLSPGQSITKTFEFGSNQVIGSHTSSGINHIPIVKTLGSNAKMTAKVTVTRVDKGKNNNLQITKG